MKNIPFLNWIKTPEGRWTMLRLLSFLLFPIAIWVDDKFGGWSRFPVFDQLIITIIISSVGAIIMIKMGYLFLTRSEFKTMLNGSKSTGIITNGLFKYTRHPFYFGFWLLYLGVLAAFHGICLFYLFMLYTVLTFITISNEEDRLCRDFKEYEEYKKNTPAFFPIFFHKFLSFLIFK